MHYVVPDKISYWLFIVFGAAGSSNTSMFTTPAVSAPSQVSGFTFGATNSATPASPFQFSGAATTANAPQPSGEFRLSYPKIQELFFTSSGLFLFRIWRNGKCSFNYV